MTSAVYWDVKHQIKQNLELLWIGKSTSYGLTLCLPVSSADTFGKQFGPRSGPTICRA